MNTIDTLCENFGKELYAEEPVLRAWWSKMVSNAENENVIWKRWPTGISGHPRVLAIYRKYYLEIAKVAVQNGNSLNPNSILIPAAEDLGFDGIVFIPIGEDEDTITIFQKGA